MRSAAKSISVTHDRMANTIEPVVNHFRPVEFNERMFEQLASAYSATIAWGARIINGIPRDSFVLTVGSFCSQK